ncbi:ISAs1 family transposase [Chloroflexota bacterium]
MMDKPESNIHRAFENVTDPRTTINLKHPLINIIAITICAVISGAEEWVEIEDYGTCKREFLEQFLDLSEGIPSHDTFGRVFRWVDPDEMANSFYAWTHEVYELTAGEVIAIDGKCLRGSKDSTHGKGAIYMVSAWATTNNLVLSAERVADKSNEITAIPRLLRLLDIEDSIVTIDAMGCQTDIAEQIIGQGGDYVLAVKDNQGTLLADVSLAFAGPELPSDTDYVRQYDDSHGRTVVRECWTTAQEDILAHINAYKTWVGLQSVVKIVTRSGEGADLMVETRYFITSLPADAALLLRSIRLHWHIENSLHWVLDVSFNEDRSRIRRDHAPENMALIRQAALNLLKHETSMKRGIKARRKKAGWDDNYLRRVLSVNV